MEINLKTCKTCGLKANKVTEEPCRSCKWMPSERKFTNWLDENIKKEKNDDRKT
jgi:ribosomal protein L37E